MPAVDMQCRHVCLGALLSVILGTSPKLELPSHLVVLLNVFEDWPFCTSTSLGQRASMGFLLSSATLVTFLSSALTVCSHSPRNGT